MRDAGDDHVADRQPFDPGVETGYLRRASRDHELDPELGAVPFDPGEGAGYDDRRARKDAKRRARAERERLEREQKEELEERERHAALIARPVRMGPSVAAAAAAATPAAEPEPVEPEPAPEPVADESAPVTELRGLKPSRPSLARRLEREREERARAEREKRMLVEREREEREREEREKREQRRREHGERLKRDREALRKQKPAERKARKPKTAEREPVRAAESPAPAHRHRIPHPHAPHIPHVRVTRPHPLRHRDLIWPTAKAGLAVTLVLAVAAAFGSLAGLPVPGLNAGAGENSNLSASSLFGVGAGTAPGLASGFVYPVGTPPPHDYGEGAAKFGAPRSGHIHEGQDVFAKPGTPLVAVRDGVVVDGGGGKSFYAYGGGNSFVMYSPDDNRSYVYLHMLHPSPLKAGDQVQAGQQIGQVGCTGSCDGPHLHFEIREGKVGYGHDTKAINPLPFLQQLDQFQPIG